MKTLFLVLALFSGCCGWTKTDTILEVTAQASLAGDWYTTQKSLNCGNLTESNPIIGSNGDRVSPQIYFPTTMLLHAVIAAALPKRARTFFQGITTGVQVKTVTSNFDQMRIAGC